jgi:MFS family permease
MKARIGMYDLALVSAAVVVWAYIISWGYFARPVWGPVVELFGRVTGDVDKFRTVYGVLFLLMTWISVVGVLTHLVVLTIPRFRAQIKPSLFSHVAAFALLWIGYGLVSKISTMEFPYMRKPRESAAANTRPA